ncbi:hypothetical protein HCZ30_13165 [Marivivens donghaensis]|uniref:Methyl-accepting transducer domain-containing protein n=2 Tax=Marivivens donghaensis TaxID=1699413 RepID=A0ABX0W370_9RHOB|nr:hypothetical protein [Marivivens donghaensis]
MARLELGVLAGSVLVSGGLVAWQLSGGPAWSSALVGVVGIGTAIFGLQRGTRWEKRFSKVRTTFRGITNDKNLSRRVGLGANCSIDSFLTELENTMQTLGRGSADVNVSSKALASAIQLVGSNSEQQSAAVEELSASVEETASVVRSNAQTAKLANELASGAARTAERGKNQVDNMVTAMDKIETSSREIMQIIKVIDEIAFQTNLLALNAAVEAARAGQHGRGFAVVAQEVRNLAARSSKAAQETSRLIETSRQQVVVGVETSSETSQTFEKINKDIAEVATRLGEINLASSEQTRAVDQINFSMTEIENLTRRNTLQADELNTTLGSLSSANEIIRNEIATYKLSNTELGHNGTGKQKPANSGAPAKKADQIAAQ